MADRVIRYVRKLSGEEALEGYVMILKESLKLFPKPGVPFKLKIGDKTHDSEIKVVDCWCQGPKKPHVHYRIEYNKHFADFRPHFGKTVIIEKVKDNVYELKEKK